MGRKAKKKQHTKRQKVYTPFSRILGYVNNILMWIVYSVLHCIKRSIGPYHKRISATIKHEDEGWGYFLIRIVMLFLGLSFDYIYTTLPQSMILAVCLGGTIAMRYTIGEYYIISKDFIKTRRYRTSSIVLIGGVWGGIFIAAHYPFDITMRCAYIAYLLYLTSLLFFTVHLTWIKRLLKLHDTPYTPPHRSGLALHSIGLTIIAILLGKHVMFQTDSLDEGGAKFYLLLIVFHCYLYMFVPLIYHAITRTRYVGGSRYTSLVLYILNVSLFFIIGIATYDTHNWSGFFIAINAIMLTYLLPLHISVWLSPTPSIIKYPRYWRIHLIISGIRYIYTIITILSMN